MPELPSYTTPDARFRAVAERDAAADGHFVYAVTSTGIYCRPTCPSRRPREDRVRFFDTPADAAAAGFRACKRCRPTEVSAAQKAVAQVQEIVHEAESAPTLADLGEAVGMSPSHLQRVFKRATGLSPKEYAVACRETRFQEGLRAGKTVTEAMYDAGFESSHALYSTARRKLGMTPKSYRRGGRGERVAYGLFPSGLGTMLVAATEAGLVSVAFGAVEDELLGALEKELPAAKLVNDPGAVEPHARRIESFLRDREQSLELPLDVQGTEFQRRVWDLLRTIPAGETRSYGEIARQLGNPKAARAVARACATNPVALVIPCHRVVQASGKRGGYRWGVEVKEKLLEHEKRTISS